MATDGVHGIGSTIAPPRQPRTTTEIDLTQAVTLVPGPYERTPPHVMRVIARVLFATGARLTEIARLSPSTFDLESHRLPTDGDGKPDFPGGPRENL
jgi:hypothetical protein